jgi:hypothetical protein
MIEQKSVHILKLKNEVKPKPKILHLYENLMTQTHSSSKKPKNWATLTLAIYTDLLT